MSYDMIDRFLRNNLGDDDYAEYSTALDSLCTPQQRTWVGLTDDERNLISTSHAYVDMIIRAAEAKLKEKNGG